VRLIGRGGEAAITVSLFGVERRRLMAKRWSTKPAANVKITINRIVLDAHAHAPDMFLIATSEQENRPAK
jgi:hypothetical protein